MKTLYLFYKGIHLGEKQVSELIDGSFHSIPSVAEGKFRDTNHVVV